ncbi:MAG: chromate transporter [Ruminococcaceae bacterium]|nr:chromate transporter [Oscillospiraceae bacterium]
MKTKLGLYFKLFISTFVLSAFTFGGGYVIVPLMRKKFVDKYGWIEEEEMLDLVAISQSCPGAIAVNASVLVGYRVAGVFGSFLCVLGTALPPLIILSVISFFYDAFRSNVYVGYALRGMQAGVAAVIADVVYGMAKNIVKNKKVIQILVMIAAFVAAYFFDISVMLILVICAALGLVFGRGKTKQ